MSNPKQYFIIQLFTKRDFTDLSLSNFIKTQNNLSISEYSKFLSNNQIQNEDSCKIVNLFIEYDGGFLMPEKCDAYEPIREKFNKFESSAPVKWLSQPGGALFLKKVKTIKYEGRIENHRFAPIWEEGKILKPKVKEPLFLGEIVIYIESKILKKKPINYLYNLLLQLSRTVNASFGLVAFEGEYTNKQNNLSNFKDESKLPGVFWINYFGEDIVKLFGANRLKELSLSKNFQYENDCVFMISDDPHYYLNNRADKDIIKILGEEFFI